MCPEAERQPVGQRRVARARRAWSPRRPARAGPAPTSDRRPAPATKAASEPGQPVSRSARPATRASRRCTSGSTSSRILVCQASTGNSTTARDPVRLGRLGPATAVQDAEDDQRRPGTGLRQQPDPRPHGNAARPHPGTSATSCGAACRRGTWPYPGRRDRRRATGRRCGTPRVRHRDLDHGDSAFVRRRLRVRLHRPRPASGARRAAAPSPRGGR